LELAGGSVPVGAAATTSYAGRSHQSRDSLSGAADPLRSKLGMHARSTVSSPATSMDVPDLFGGSSIGLCPRRWWPVLPSVVPRAGNAQDPTHQRNRKARPLRLDEPVCTHRVPSALAKKAAAFFKKSRSCFRTLTSRRSLLSSSRSSVVSPSRSPWSISAYLTQRLSDSSAMPSSLATCGKDFSEERKSRSACSRNSGGYGAPLICMWISSSWIYLPHLQLSTKPTQFHTASTSSIAFARFPLLIHLDCKVAPTLCHPAPSDEQGCEYRP
jgi:hypothetical protein